MKVKILILLGLILSAFVLVPNRTITGYVKDVNQQPLANVIVTAKGSSIKVKTDLKGHFSIGVPANSKALIFSYANLETQEVPLGKADVIQVVMHTATAHERDLLDEQQLAFTPTAPSPSKMVRMSTTSYVRSAPLQRRQTENYKPINENGFQLTGYDPVTTFSADVDRASYSNIRRFLNMGQLPPADAIRVEEMINYFDYEYPQPKGQHPIAITTEFTDSPWNPGLKLLHIGLQAKTVSTENLPASNLVFLIDVSGSMLDDNKLPLLKQAFKLLVDQLRAEDKISIVAYAGAAGLVLPPTAGSEKMKIKEALDNLEAGGSTAGGAGIELAYKLAKKNFLDDGNNRVILATDGDFNVGVSSEGELQRLIENKRKEGVFLSVLGFGMGNFKDSHVETLADKGNGNYAYIDNIQEARKVFVSEFGGTLFTIAKDVKIQIEFNPKHVKGYRLIGYENRALKNEEFHDDRKDAGDMGSGHSVTAIYEIVPAGITSTYLAKSDALKYQKTDASEVGKTDEMLTMKIRYKKPESAKSVLLDIPVKNAGKPFAACSDNLRFASAVAEFGLLLRNSDFKGAASYNHVIATAKAAFAKDMEGYRSEFVRLVKTTQALDQRLETAGK